MLTLEGFYIVSSLWQSCLSGNLSKQGLLLSVHSIFYLLPPIVSFSITGLSQLRSVCRITVLIAALLIDLNSGWNRAEVYRETPAAEETRWLTAGTERGRESLWLKAQSRVLSRCRLISGFIAAGFKGIAEVRDGSLTGAVWYLTSIWEERCRLAAVISDHNWKERHTAFIFF